MEEEDENQPIVVVGVGIGVGSGDRRGGRDVFVWRGEVVGMKEVRGVS